eukprot:CAMPEP_0206514064 /NCGR_PEP_ID=MMETSP0324_2-20121206/61901_1 /ASSEMBLY_ACC=CAM_ASM_000836 /TAXON_ID=2866 /ORGANISM="Crypthecodinium cohnii, Strain Seligo" /LENGTH=406 /DNA_ID=CAMNT_0054006439 /DNA_START=73 /DNA_END=1294 /DNA_ORIENTATION=+
MAEAKKRVVVVGGGMSAKHTAESLLKKNKALEVTIIQACKFQEWPLAMPAVLVDPKRHKEALAPNPSSFQAKGIQYLYGPVTFVDPSKKTVTYKSDKGDEVVTYDALVLATGFSMPFIYPKPGCTLQERQDEVQQVASSVSEAKSVAIVGGGVVGAEVAAMVKTKYPTKSVTILSRSKVLELYGDKLQPKMQAQLEKMGIKVVVGDCSAAPKDVTLQAGEVKVGDQTVNYDVLFPIYSAGPNTSFVSHLAGCTDERGLVKVNEYLQSTQYPEIFAVGVGNQKMAYVGVAKLQPMWDLAGKNIVSFLGGKAMAVYKEAMPGTTHPPALLLGTGPNAYGFFDFAMLPVGAKVAAAVASVAFRFAPRLAAGSAATPAAAATAAEAPPAAARRSACSRFPGSSAASTSPA